MVGFSPEHSEAAVHRGLGEATPGCRGLSGLESIAGNHCPSAELTQELESTRRSWQRHMTGNLGRIQAESVHQGAQSTESEFINSPAQQPACFPRFLLFRLDLRSFFS